MDSCIHYSHSVKVVGFMTIQVDASKNTKQQYCKFTNLMNACEVHTNEMHIPGTSLGDRAALRKKSLTDTKSE